MRLFRGLCHITLLLVAKNFFIFHPLQQYLCTISMAIKHSIRHLCTHMRKKKEIAHFRISQTPVECCSTEKFTWNNETKCGKRPNNIACDIFFGKTKQMNKKAPHISCAIFPHCCSLPKNILFMYPRHRMSNINKSYPWVLASTLVSYRSPYRAASSFYEIAYFAHEMLLSFYMFYIQSSPACRLSTCHYQFVH